MATRSYSRKIAVGASVAFGLLLAIVLFRSLTSGRDTVELHQLDSLKRINTLSNFYTGFIQSDTSVVENVLKLNEMYYSEKLDKDTALVSKAVKRKIDGLIRKDIQFNLPIIYQKLSTQKLRVSDHFADSIDRFIDETDVRLSRLDSMKGYFQVPDYNNTIENDSLVSFTSDSTGFSISYNEVGNFFPGKNSFERSPTRVRVPTNINFDKKLKITSLTYGAYQQAPQDDKRNKIRVDIFIVTGSGATRLQNLFSETIYQKLTSSDRFLPRQRNWTQEMSKIENLDIYDSEILFNKGEEKEARKISQMILTATGRTFKLKAAPRETPDYISVFISGDQSKSK